MEVIINQEVFNIQNDSLIEALRIYGLQETSGIAIAVNDHVIPKSSWNSFQVHPQDNIIIIRAAQGG
ncbi:sulfur carrier protein ThiS [Olivibacter sp. SDN3]|uniref:sulfur carrier protein ThiS n=1 Tax=Olivibacter sp. SDN3 TaxID=2764720 RepID=UPI0016512306|nr:sulfur carrier protein ThiS [Olivibacter sp. SDN3]QNL51198.1 sulfur carrier protein ThiS [Olivibacter sp. SDN3]